MNSKLVTLLVLLMAVLNLVPPLFVGTTYHDNVYYVIMYILLSYLALVIPFLFSNINRIISYISMFLGGWFVSGLIFELFNICVPKKVLNSIENNMVYNSYLIMFIIALSFIITHESWRKQRK